MDKFKYKIKEIGLGDSSSKKGIKTTVTNIDPESGAITWKVEDAPDFESIFNSLKKTRDFLNKLSKNTVLDNTIQDIQKQIISLFNKFSSHLRKTYPEEYQKITSVVSEISSISSTSGFTSGDEGENHTGPSPRKSTYGAYTQAGFKKVNEGPGATLGPGPKAGPEGVTKNKYVTDFKYKLVNQKALNKKAKGIEVKQLWKEADGDVETFLKDNSINEPSRKKFVASRLLGFSELERKLNELIPLLQQAKHKTMDYYRQNPESYEVVYGTDLANDYLNDLIELFKD